MVDHVRWALCSDALALRSWNQQFPVLVVAVQVLRVILRGVADVVTVCARLLAMTPLCLTISHPC